MASATRKSATVVKTDDGDLYVGTVERTLTQAGSSSTSSQTTQRQTTQLRTTQQTVATLAGSVSTAGTTTTMSTTAGAGSTAAKVLSWNAPTRRQNGSSLYLREIGGYHLGIKNLQSGNYTTWYFYGGDSNRTSLTNLKPGRYAFRVQAYDLDGYTSEFSSWLYLTI